jgi:serine/threonine protein phosphatase PrpC
MDEVRSALKGTGKTLNDEQLHTLCRALGREKRIEAPEKRKSFATNTPLRRSNTSVLQRVSTNHPSATGPLVLAGGALNRVSTCVTRSIGDWDGARAMIPQPDVLRFDVGASQHVRVILCSDGVWDVLSLHDACKLARASPSAAAAADGIVELAYRRSMQRFERLKDDTTCVVVDLNPSLMPFAKPAGAGGGGCCAVM